VCIKVQSAGIQLRTRTETMVRRILQTLSKAASQRALVTHRVPHSTGIPPHQMEVNAGFTDLGLVVWAVKMASLTTCWTETVEVIINSMITVYTSTSMSGNALAKLCMLFCCVQLGSSCISRVPLHVYSALHVYSCKSKRSKICVLP